jgi:hypothetical protein
MPTYLKDLITLPEQVRQGDFVLRLAEGIQQPEQTLENYVVTPQLAACFDRALGMIQASLQGRTSKGAYLHGSFGSGKSHFMAVLLLLLEQHPSAWRLPELAGVLGKHHWAAGKKFLLVPYHMIGARDLTSALLGGYAEFVARRHPDRPHPGVYRSEAILASAANLRTKMGDVAFFAALNAGTATGDDGWGALGAAWDGTTFGEACTAAPTDERRVRLVGDLVATLFTHARGTTEHVDLDAGLAVLSQHASALGYDAVILFLDELVLWLASHAADPRFVTQQGQLLSKLVEAQNANRPAPLVSFIARQRDLRELVGDTMLGAQYVSFSDSLKWWDQRFDVIKLEDRNLPTIAEKRVLKPRNEAARQQIDQSFRETERVRREVLDVLLTSHGDRDLFRKIYPFSPALMETLVALSSLLQRERTALRIMLQLLVDQRDRLKLGDVVPVGDLFDVIMKGEEPFSDVMKAHFDQARRLYEQKLRPLIEAEHGLSWEQAGRLPAEDPKAQAFRRDDRLAKTLLLSALAPEVESFRAMTVNKLAALNHGTIRTPVPGREGQFVFERCRKWAAVIGQIRLGDEPANQTVSVQLTGVDTESLLSQAATEDNTGNQIRKVKELIYEMMGLTLVDELWIAHTFTWRATRRQCQVLFANVRELTDETLANPGDEWKIILDFPFDPEEGRAPRDDLARVQRFEQQQGRTSRTLVWLPSFLKAQARKELGLLVKLDHLLTGARFESYASRLSAVERAQARGILESQRSALRQKLRAYLEAAYGLGGDKSALDATHALEPDEQIVSLHSSATPPVPSGATLRQATDQLLDAALAAQFPAHPRFEPEARTSGVVVKRVWGELERGLQAPDGRSPVEPALRRDVRLLAEPLKLATMGETHLVLSPHWRQHFVQKEAQHGGAMTVGRLRKWIDDPLPMGLPVELQNLIIVFFAAQSDRTFVQPTGPVQPGLDELRDEMGLREQPLPPERAWLEAVVRAQAIFGLTPGEHRNATNVARLTSSLREQSADLVEAARALVAQLQTRLQAMGLGEGQSARFVAASDGLSLVEAIRAATERQVIEAFANAPLQAKPLVVGTTLRKAADVAGALRQARWTLIEAAASLADERRAAGQTLAQRVRDVLAQDEQLVGLVAVLRQIEDDAARLLADAPKPPGPSSPPRPSPPQGPQGCHDRPPPEQPPTAVPTGEPDVGAALKRLYGRSQVVGDSLPPGLPPDRVREVLEVHVIRPPAVGARLLPSDLIVVSPTLRALIAMDPACEVDLAGKRLRLFGVDLRLDVDPRHHG